MVNPNFKVSELIATGGMASIYRGIQVSLDRPIAIKRLHPHLTSKIDFVARFEKEAKSVARLRHENIVSIIDFGKDEEGYFLVMEFVDGKNLKEILKTEKKMPAEIGLVIAEAVAQGLRFAHSAGIVHRDIKPANIMLSKDGTVKIADFGIAKFTGDISTTATGSMIGSPAYMSPEHVRGTDLDSRADIFSLGVVLYEILSGKKPFPGENYQEVITRILTEEPEPLSQITPEISLGLSEIVHRALDKEKLRRYQNCEDLLLDLKKQFDFYEIQSEPKLVSDFLANPGLISSKLVGERIQRHLDWGLHYFNQGEVKIPEARKEFREVLRWDKENPTALKYLAKIEQPAVGNHKSIIWQSLRRLGRDKRIWGGTGLLTAALLGIWLGGYFGESSNPVPAASSPKQESVTPNENNLNSTPPASGRDQASKNALILYNSEKEKERARNKAGLSMAKQRQSAEFGYLIIKAQPQARVEIDGKVYGSVPPAITIKAEEGKYKIYLKQKGYKTVSKKVWVQKGKRVLIDESLRKDISPQKSNPGDF